MNYTDALMSGMLDESIQAAFRVYYEELGVRVTNWDGLFEEINRSADRVYVRKAPDGRVIGFLMFVTSEAVTVWRGFFTTKLGCIEEFWIAPECRNQGHGTALLQLAELKFSQEGCAYVILTTDTAPDFYRKNGYTLQKGIVAKNKADVYVKPLIR